MRDKPVDVQSVDGSRRWDVKREREKEVKKRRKQVIRGRKKEFNVWIKRENDNPGTPVASLLDVQPFSPTISCIQMQRKPKMRSGGGNTNRRRIEVPSQTLFATVSSK